MPKTAQRESIASGTPYPLDAFAFVRDALEHTSNAIHGMPESGRHSRHVNGRQLCEGIREYAAQQFGRLAPLVLRRWNIHRTDDFGAIVFVMIEAGLLRKNETDTIDDFRAVYDFDEAFEATRLC